MARPNGTSKVVLSLAALALAVGALAQSDAEKFRQAVLKLVSDRNPEVKASRVDHHTLRVRRLDLVDARGVIRMTIAAEMPDPIVDGVAYKRVAPVSGIMVRDDQGNERGGYGFMSGRDAAIITIDHRNSEAAGITTLQDGTTMLVLNAPADAMREPTLGDRVLPGNGKTQIKLSVAPDGSPEIFLADKQQRPRVRLVVTKEGYGALEFLNAKGEVVETLAPERQRTRG